jgi:stress-induced morphogen
MLRGAARCASGMATVASRSPGPVQARVEALLRQGLAPVQHLEVVNESAGHNVPKGSETHFKVVVVAPCFEGASVIERHRTVNALLAPELAAGVHALSIVAKTPAQWAANAKVDASPKCMGGSKH